MCLKKLAEFLSCLSWLSLPALYMYYTPLGDANVNDSCCFVSLIKMSSYIAGRLPLLCFRAFQLCQGKGQRRFRQQTLFSVCRQVLLLETLTSQSSAPTACYASDIKCLCMCIWAWKNVLTMDNSDIQLRKAIYCLRTKYTYIVGTRYRWLSRYIVILPSTIAYYTCT